MKCREKPLDALFLAHGSDGGSLLDRPKSNQKGAGTYGFPSSLYASGNRLRHPWPSAWLLGLDFRCPLRWRPLFFIQEKKRRPPSSLKAAGIRNLVHLPNIELSSITKQRAPVSKEGDGAASFQEEKQRSGTEAMTLLPDRRPWMAAAF